MVNRVTGQYVRTKADERAVVEGCTFDPKAADKVRGFFAKFLRHSKGKWAGKPFELLDWQWQDVVAPLFGWKRPDGSRRFRRAYVEIPKKNGKSTLASGIGLYMLLGDGEAGAEVYSVGSDQAQASIVHGEAIAMVRASRGLSSYLKINESTRNIAFPKTASWYRALSGEHAGKEGLNAHCLIQDEVHVWHGRKTWDALRYAGRARHQPLAFSITTAGDDMLSVCREQHDYAAAVNAGQIEDTRYFGYIRAAEPDDDWKDPAVWRKANPSLGVMIDEGEFAADAAAAEKSPASQSAFKRYSLNVWATSTNPWLKRESWAACRDEFTAKDLEGRECYAGLDLSKKYDMTALALIFPDGEDRYLLLCWFWLPEATINDPDKPEHYRVWESQGWLEKTPGSVCDYAFVKKRVAEVAARYDLRELAFDPWNAEKTTQELEEEHAVRRVEFRQTLVNFAEPTGEFERLVLSGGLRHNGHPILAWQAGHVSVRTDSNNNKRPVKPPDWDDRKIDGIVAGIMALARARHGTTASVYETRGMETVGW